MERSADCAQYLHPGTGWGSSACGGMTLARSKSHYTGRCGVQRPEARGFNSRHLHHFGPVHARSRGFVSPGPSGVSEGIGVPGVCCTQVWCSRVWCSRGAPVRRSLGEGGPPRSAQTEPHLRSFPEPTSDRSAAADSFSPMTGATRPGYTEPPESRPAEAALGACSRHHPEILATTRQAGGH